MRFALISNVLKFWSGGGLLNTLKDVLRIQYDYLTCVFYLFIGWLTGKISRDIRYSASWFLTRFIIPVVIIVNTSAQFSNMGNMISVTTVIILAILTLEKYINGDPVMIRCFTYLNIGWSGLPVASALFVNDAALIVIAAYTGSSVAGNPAGASM